MPFGDFGGSAVCETETCVLLQQRHVCFCNRDMCASATETCVLLQDRDPEGVEVRVGKTVYGIGKTFDVGHTDDRGDSWAYVSQSD